MTNTAAPDGRSTGGPPALYAAIRRLDPEWIQVAAAWGFSVVREPGAYVSYCGDGVLRVAPYEDLDPDDCLAQIVLHELCHYAVEGLASRDAWDWGLDNTSVADVEQEHAAVRAQAALLEPFGLREVLAPTTDFRAYHDTLPRDPLEGPPSVCGKAARGLGRIVEHPAWGVTRAALEQVASVAGSASFS